MRDLGLRFVEEVGFCFAFSADFDELPSLWAAARPEDSQKSQAYLARMWGLRDMLPIGSTAYYGRLLLRKPTLIARQFLPYFYVLSGRCGDRLESRREHARGRLSILALQVMEQLTRPRPRTTVELKTLLHRPADTRLDRALAELELGFYVTRVFDGREPFSYSWVPFARVYRPVVRQASRISEDRARVAILERHFRNQLVATVAGIHRIYRWSRQDIFRALGQLTRQGIITGGITVDGRDHRYYCLIR